jgi:acyl-CoA dehydrogenase
MSTLDPIFIETIDRLCEDQAGRELREGAEQGHWPAGLWAAFRDVGLTRCLLPEDEGGAGLDLEAAMRALRRCAMHAVPLPLAESMIAARLLQAAGIDVPDAVLAVGAVDAQGQVPRVAWGEQAGFLVVVEPGPHGEALALYDGTPRVVSRARNLAGEPRPTLATEGMRCVARQALADASELLMRYGALARSVQMAGALERALQLSLQYANERVQFGRPIGKFQAVQHLLAQQASHAAAASAACDAALDASAGHPDPFLVAVAKARVSEAAGQGADIAHQVHGAMGFTREHSLHNVTRRLYAWRDEYGNEVWWQRWIGRRVSAQGADALWPMLTAL